MRGIIIFVCLCFFIRVSGQNYQALHGSDYAGSLGLGYNPSSILSTPLSWDFTLLGFQTKNYSDLYYLYKNQQQASPPIALWFHNGASKKYIHNSSNLNIFNFRARVNKNNAIAFGMNFRTNTWGQTSFFNLQDSVTSSNSFLDINLNNQPLSLELYSSSWMETFGSLAKTVFNNKFNRLNAGVTLKITKGLAAINLNAQNGKFQQLSSRNYPSYYFTSADLEYGYSSTLEKTYSSPSAGENIKDFMSYTQGNISMDMGLTWIVKEPSEVFLYDEEMNEKYSLKVAISLMDLGSAKYSFGLQSMKTSGVSPNAKGVSLENKFDNTIQSINVLNDTLGTMVSQSSHLYGLYNIQNPTRLILNIDKRVSDHIFINGEFVMGLYGLLPGVKYKTTEIGLATITPRFENRNLGIYFPLSINKYKQTWIGAAFKLGPIVGGVHNLNLLTAKHDLQNGGGYIALVISPYKIIKKNKSTGIKCPI